MFAEKKLRRFVQALSIRGRPQPPGITLPQRVAQRLAEQTVAVAAGGRVKTGMKPIGSDLRRAHSHINW